MSEKERPDLLMELMGLIEKFEEDNNVDVMEADNLYVIEKDS